MIKKAYTQVYKKKKGSGDTYLWASIGNFVYGILPSLLWGMGLVVTPVIIFPLTK